jgi:hypothetical protein
MRAVIALAIASPCLAQDSSAARQQFETRADLEAQQQQAEAQHRTSEAWLLKTRLQNGDFQEGDRIVLVVQGNPKLSDTLTVRAGKVLQLPLMADLPLQGVLRSELPKRLTDHLAEYLRDPTARVTPLVRIGVLGHVREPGYYYTSADVLLTDIIMKAGGPAPDADMKHIVIRRGPDVIWSAADTRTALTDGLSLDRLHLRAGDEIDVSGQSNFPWGTFFTVAGSLVGIMLAFVRFH